MTVTVDTVDEIALGAVHDYGDHALLLEFDSTAEVLAWTDALRGADLLGVLDVVPASRTVLLKFAASRYREPNRQRLAALRVAAADVAAAVDPLDRVADVVIDVTYDGEDLDEVARLTAMTVEEVVAAHTAAPMRVGFGGFAPGFGYLIGGDPRLHVARRGEPRTKVPAGSVALAGEFSGVYPRESPGGWQLIGRTDAVLWDLDRDPPALLTPGAWVQFRAIG
ncbi:5-oxoprolinase subunit B family protein [Mycolicibacterium arenosum]|uniref:Carboxyltransferase domain-containing protein n=1 Tax=Mycolicibacterium arenosum TaxID=2952157 RepID=A0ABT1LZF1_9MYCO|nr:carboxyltransferase domain-containing protein [Mycolicibacterium sp. CAU 1645]MCP9272283.1 carboxyltransferase domain-containing protein [Mycolicibacterium sp. CAU 1645]